MPFSFFLQILKNKQTKRGAFDLFYREGWSLLTSGYAKISHKADRVRNASAPTILAIKWRRSVTWATKGLREWVDELINHWVYLKRFICLALQIDDAVCIVGILSERDAFEDISHI